MVYAPFFMACSKGVLGCGSAGAPFGHIAFGQITFRQALGRKIRKKYENQ